MVVSLRSKLGEALLDALYADWEKLGPPAIERVRSENPVAYLKIIASMLPREVDLRVNELDELSEDELLARLRAGVRELMAAGILDGDESP